MSMKPIDLTGGKSVYCFNEVQIAKAFEMFEAENKSGEKIRRAVDELEADLTRNEQATLAFVIIDRLNKTSPH